MSRKILRKTLCLSRWQARYALAVGSVVVTTVIRVLLAQDLGSGSGLMLFLVAVVISSLCCGMGPGFLAMALSILTCYAFQFIGEPQFSLFIFESLNAVKMALFIFDSVLFAVLCGTLRQLLVEREELLSLERRARQNAEAVETKMRLITDAIPAPVVYLRSDMTYDYINAAFGTWFGRTVENTIGKSISEVVGPEQFAKRKPFLEKALLGQAVTYDIITNCQLGVLNTTHSYVPDIDEHGRVRGIVALSLDVTERRRIEAELQDHATKFRLMSMATNDALWDWDIVKDRLSWSDSVYSSFKFRKEDVDETCQWWARHIHDDDRARILQSLEKIFADGKANWSGEYRFHRGDGSVAFVYDRGYVVYDEEKRPIRMIGAMQDVTASKEAVAVVTEWKNRYEAIIQASDQIVWDYDLLAQQIVYGGNYLKVLGYTKEEMGSTLDKWVEKIHPDDRDLFFILVDEIRKKREPCHLKYRMIRKDGTVIDVEDNGFFIFDRYGNESRMLGSVQDVTEQRRAEQILRENESQKAQLLEYEREARQAAEAASQAKTRFLANISHEIRTPLGAILGFAELMLDPECTESEKVESLRTILRNGKMLSHVINDILDLAKIEAEKLELEILPTDVMPLAENLVALFRIQAQTKGLDLQLQFSEELPRTIFSDPTRLRQILINLIGNAIKFTEQGRIQFQVQQVTNSNGRELIAFAVEDTGIGMSEEQITRLFQPFVQADSSTTRKFGGTGLGLALAKKLAQALGGDLIVEKSALGLGSRLVVTIAADWPQPDVPRKPQALAKEAEPRVQPLFDRSVLLVEDSRDNRALISRILERAGARVTVAGDGVEGVELAQENDYDVVLMDIQMPRLDGYGALKNLRQLGYIRPVVALTAHAMKGDREKCLDLGFDAYLVKPIDRTDLLQTVKRLSTMAIPEATIE